MSQHNFNSEVIRILEMFAEKLGCDKYSEPKHEIIGDPIADRIRDLYLINPEESVE